MRFRLRTLLIALCVAPLAIGAVVWTLWPEPGSPATIREFEWALASNSKLGMELATRRCFAVGVPAKRYESLFAKASSVDSGESYGFPKTAKVYEFPGGNSAVEGKFGVFVIVDGEPPVIVRARVSVYLD